MVFMFMGKYGVLVLERFSIALGKPSQQRRALHCCGEVISHVPRTISCVCSLLRVKQTFPDLEGPAFWGPGTNELTEQVAGADQLVRSFDPVNEHTYGINNSFCLSHKNKVHTATSSLTKSLAESLTELLTKSLIESLTESLTKSLTQLLDESLTIIASCPHKINQCAPIQFGHLTLITCWSREGHCQTCNAAVSIWLPDPYPLQI